MRTFLLLPATDTTLTGRVDYFALPQQTLMEMLVQNVAVADEFREDSEQFRDIAKWPGLLCISTGDVKKIIWGYFSLGGAINIEWIPTSVETFAADGNLFRGTARLSDLHRTSLKIFTIQENKLTGSADLSHLPDQLEHLSLASNMFSGSVDLAHLPETLTLLDLHNNAFGGALNLTSLPAALTWISLMHNLFEGSVDLKSLPSRMETIYLNENRLTGSVELLNLPISLKWLDMGDNTFTGDVVMGGRRSHRLRIDLRSTQVTRVVDLNGNEVSVLNVSFDKPRDEGEEVNKAVDIFEYY